MAKISRPIIYVAVLGAVAYAAVILTEPEKPTARPVRRSAPAAQAPKGYATEDLNAKFPRYTARSRDAFLPKVAASPSAASGAAAGGGASIPDPVSNFTTGVWMLTGITSINGVRSALIENGSAGESVFLKAGDIWKGMRVAAVEPNALVVVSPSGKRTRFGFPAFEQAPAASAAPPVPSIPGTVPDSASVAPVILPTPPGFRGRRSVAPLMAVPIPADPRNSPEPSRSSNSDNQTNSPADMRSASSDTGLAAGAGQPDLDE